jgi:hypothetical protein
LSHRIHLDRFRGLLFALIDEEEKRFPAFSPFVCRLRIG